MPINLKNLRKLFPYLPTFGRKKWDDHIFGATRYLANTLRIIINETDASDLIDQPMTTIEKDRRGERQTFTENATMTQ
jgi:hypothetical protein